jgi:6-phosphogluconolactonase
MNLKPFRPYRLPFVFWKGKILSSLMLGVSLVGASPLCAQTAGFAYVVNNSAAGIGSVSAYTINATTGALTPIVGSPFAVGSDPTFVAVSPNGRFAYVTISSDAGIGSVSAYTIDKGQSVSPDCHRSPCRTIDACAPCAVENMSMYRTVRSTSASNLA